MEIDKTINKWFEETAVQIEEYIKAESPTNALCVSALEGAKNYCNAVLLLLSRGYEMPVKALMRVLCELTIKLVWCLQSPHGKEDNDITCKKIQRWEKTTLLNNIKRLQDFKNTVSENQLTKIANLIDRLKKEALFSNSEVKEMPQISQMCEQLSDDVKNKLYPQLYVDFHNAVHLDAKSLVDIFMQNKNETSSHFGCKYNIKNLGKFCMFFAVNINGFIRLNYGLDVTQMVKEYHETTRS